LSKRFFLETSQAIHILASISATTCVAGRPWYKKDAGHASVQEPTAAEILQFRAMTAPSD
jgi:hypothetical protein